MYVAPGDYTGQTNLRITRPNLTITGMTDDTYPSGNKSVIVRGNIVVDVSTSAVSTSVTENAVRLSNLTVVNSTADTNVLNAIGRGYTLSLNNMVFDQNVNATAIRFATSQDASGNNYSSRAYLNKVLVVDMQTRTANAFDVEGGQVWQLENCDLTTGTGRALYVSSDNGIVQYAKSSIFYSGSGPAIDISSNNQNPLTNTSSIDLCTITSNNISGTQAVIQLGGTDVSSSSLRSAGFFNISRSTIINNGTTASDASEAMISVRPFTTITSTFNNFAAPLSIGNVVNPYQIIGDTSNNRVLLYSNNSYITAPSLITPFSIPLPSTLTLPTTNAGSGWSIARKLRTEP